SFAGKHMAARGDAVALSDPTAARAWYRAAHRVSKWDDYAKLAEMVTGDVPDFRFVLRNSDGCEQVNDRHLATAVKLEQNEHALPVLVDLQFSSCNVRS